MNIWIDSAIFQLQTRGGISTLWRALLPRLQAALPDCTFDTSAPPDVFISTYYQPAPKCAKNIVVIYDFIAEMYAPIGAYHPDALAKRSAIASADALISISQHVASDCQMVTGRASTVAHLATDLQRVSLPQVQAFEARHKLNKPYLLLVGRRDLYKNARALYQAYALWGQDVTVLAVGGEECTPDDAAFARRFDWRRVELSDADLCAAYSGALALVYPSLVEGFGLPVLEAMACGCPVIAGAHSSIAEVAGDALIQCDPFRPASIASALSTAVQPERRMIHILKGYARAKQFSWNKTADIIAGVIRNV